MVLTSRDGSTNFIEARVAAGYVGFRLTGRACEGLAAKTNMACGNGSVYLFSKHCVNFIFLSTYRLHKQHYVKIKKPPTAFTIDDFILTTQINPLLIQHRTEHPSPAIVYHTYLLNQTNVLHTRPLNVHQSHT